jgi:ubiquitin carboxyl-terminal hydrolase 4/11/15
LAEYFITGKYKSEINRVNPLGMKGKIAEEFGSLLKVFNSFINSILIV